ncbi:MAG: MFS transporter [Chloroflexi bacterium]|nr:MFS transporter [Chloroflexota bacterium]
MSPLLPSIREEFKLDYTQTGFMLAALNLTMGFANLPAGWLADRVGRRLLITISICGVGLFGLLIGFVQSYWMMVALLVLFGAISGGYHVSASPLIAASTEPKKQGSALGLHMIGGTGSLLVAPLAAVSMAAVWGWRGPYIALSIPIIIFGVVFYVLLGRKLSAKEKSPDTVSVRAETMPATDSDAKAMPKPTRRGVLVPFMVLTVLAGALLWTPIAFLPLFLTDKFGASQIAVGVFVSTVALGGFISAPLGGYLSDRFGQVRVMVILVALAAPLIFLLNVVPYGVLLGALLIGVGMIAATRIPIGESFIITHAPERHRSMILGVYYFSAQEFSAVLTPVLGKLIDLTDFTTAFNVAAAVMLVVVTGCSIWLWRAEKAKPIAA